MKALAAFGIFLLFLAAIALVNLRNMNPADSEAARALSASDLNNSGWKLAALRDAPGAASAAIEVVFSDDGVLHGNGPCHAFSLRYQHDGNELVFTDPRISSSSCAKDTASHETALLAQLSESASAETDGKRLVLLSADGTRLVRFRKSSE